MRTVRFLRAARQSLHTILANAAKLRLPEAVIITQGLSE